MKMIGVLVESVFVDFIGCVTLFLVQIQGALFFFFFSMTVAGDDWWSLGIAQGSFSNYRSRNDNHIFECEIDLIYLNLNTMLFVITYVGDKRYLLDM